MVLKIKRSLFLVICFCAVAAIPFLGRWLYTGHGSLPAMGTGQDYARQALINLMQNYVQDDVGEFYQEYYRSPVYVDSWETVVTDIQKINDGDFIVTFGVKPYLGPHDSIGYDEISYAIRTFGTPERTDYAHLRNEELPEASKSLRIKEPAVRSKD